METRECNFKIITPIFSYGANNSHSADPEIRVASIKGMMRYMFRIAQPTLASDKLLEFEDKIFGDAKSKASPVRLAVVSKPNADHQPSQFLQHKEKGKKRPFSPAHNKTFTVRMALRPKTRLDLDNLKNLKAKKSKSLNEEEMIELEKLASESLKDPKWYQSLLELSFLLVGLGQRSRKGRGRSSCKVYKSEEELKCDVFKMLKAISETADYKFEKENDCIIFNGESSLKRPFIEKIEFGRAKEKTWQKFFFSLDWASHDIKDASNRNKNNAVKSSIVEEDKRQFRRNSRERNRTFHATGESNNPRFASSIIVGCAQIGKKILPIYTYVRPVLSVEENVRDKNGKFIIENSGEKKKVAHICRIDAEYELRAFIENFEKRWNS